MSAAQVARQSAIPAPWMLPAPPLTFSVSLCVTGAALPELPGSEACGEMPQAIARS
jgi:hypothetical protein